MPPASMPWQELQPAWKSARPLSTRLEDDGAADACSPPPWPKPGPPTSTRPTAALAAVASARSSGLRNALLQKLPQRLAVLVCEQRAADDRERRDGQHHRA